MECLADKFVKVSLGIDCCTTSKFNCRKCPYKKAGCVRAMVDDARCLMAKCKETENELRLKVDYLELKNYDAETRASYFSEQADRLTRVATKLKNENAELKDEVERLKTRLNSLTGSCPCACKPEKKYPPKSGALCHTCVHCYCPIKGCSNCTQHGDAALKMEKGTHCKCNSVRSGEPCPYYEEAK